MTPILGILIGIVGTLVLLAIAIVVTMRLRGHNDAKEGYPAAAPPEKAVPGSAACHIPANNPDLLTVKFGTSRGQPVLERGEVTGALSTVFGHHVMILNHLPCSCALASERRDCGSVIHTCFGGGGGYWVNCTARQRVGCWVGCTAGQRCAPGGLKCWK